MRVASVLLVGILVVAGCASEPPPREDTVASQFIRVNFTANKNAPADKGAVEEAWRTLLIDMSRDPSSLALLSRLYSGLPVTLRSEPSPPVARSGVTIDVRVLNDHARWPTDLWFAANSQLVCTIHFDRPYTCEMRLTPEEKADLERRMSETKDAPCARMAVALSLLPSPTEPLRIAIDEFLARHDSRWNCEEPERFGEGLRARIERYVERHHLVARDPS